MKLLAIFILIATTASAMANDVRNCQNLKLRGKYHCELQGQVLRLDIQNKNRVLNVKATSENESFIIDGTLHNRYSWTTDYAYSGSCSANELKIDTYKRGELEGVITLRPLDSGLAYSISKGNQTLSLDCKRL